MASKVPSIDPAKFKDEEFELWSIPAFDGGAPEYALGSAIGSAKKQVKPNDVLLSRIVPHIRRSWVVTAKGRNQRQIASGEWIIFRGAEVYPDYLRHVLISDPFHVQFMATVAGVGGSLLRARPEAVKLIKIPLPPLPEQRRIAGILDQADALRRLRRQSLSRLSDLGQAIFHEMFEDGASADWPKLSIADVVDHDAGGIRTGPFGSQLLHSEFVESGIAVLGIDNAVSNTFRWAKERFITREKYVKLSRYKVYPGDVLITIMGTCGRCAIVPEDVGDAINTKHLCCISLNKSRCLPEYLHSYFLYHRDALRYLGVRSKGAIMDGLNGGLIKAMPLTLPPIELQHQFVKKLEKIKVNESECADACLRAQSLFASLQHRAFRGEL